MLASPLPSKNHHLQRSLRPSHTSALLRHYVPRASRAGGHLGLSKIPLRNPCPPASPARDGAQGSWRRSFAPSSIVVRWRVRPRPRPGRGATPRRLARARRRPSSRPHESKLLSRPVDISGAVDAMVNAARGESELELNERTLGWPEVVARLLASSRRHLGCRQKSQRGPAPASSAIASRIATSGAPDPTA